MMIIDFNYYSVETLFIYLYDSLKQFMLQVITPAAAAECG